MSDELIRLASAMEPVTRPGISTIGASIGCGKNAGWGFCEAEADAPLVLFRAPCRGGAFCSD